VPPRSSVAFWPLFRHVALLVGAVRIVGGLAEVGGGRTHICLIIRIPDERRPDSDYLQEEGRPMGTFVLIVALVSLFGIEVATHTMGDETALLKLGALPTNGQLNSQYWRLLTYSFLHLNPLHLLLNVALFWWIGRVV
jgi:membrane associated rhomboid family serine protease